MTDSLLSASAKHMGLTRRDIALIVRNAPKRYKVYTIKKRSGGERTIAQPARELKDLQYFLMRKILFTLPVHDAAKAYRLGQSIRDNALVHARNPIILKMDFTDFFGSVKQHDFVRLCRDNGIDLDEADQKFCCNVLFWREQPTEAPKLSVGAPSSPMLSNAIVYKFDEVVAGMCADAGVSYSRYADDLTFSAERAELLIGIRAEIPRILKRLQYPILYVNWNKTTLVTKKYRRAITGVVISNSGNASLGRHARRKLRATVHAYTLGRMNRDQSENLRGHLAFCKSVDPEYFEKLGCRYGVGVLKKLLGRSFRRKGKPRELPGIESE